MVLSLQARSTEVDSEIFPLEIAWDGEWADGDTEIKRHLVVKGGH